MKKSISLIGCLILASASLAQITELKSVSDKAQSMFNQTSPSPLLQDKLPYVNPFVGTGGHGHTYPGASVPFGMMQLSPDTRHDGWDGCSGYHYSDDVIYGFSHTHLSGTGVSDYGDLLIVPQNGSPRIDPAYIDEKKGYGSHFSHKNEKASPGYYSVHLDDPDIDVQLSTTTRAGIHEYTFNNSSGKKFILIDLDYRDKLLSSAIEIEGDSVVYGHRVSQAWATKQEFHFYMESDIPFQKARKFEKDGRHKLLLIYPRKTGKVTLRVGMSAVDWEGAKRNVDAEIPNFDLNAVKIKAENAWRKELNKIQFYALNHEVMVNFYTALYHSYLNPNVFSDVDRRYRGYDGQIHTLPQGSENNYTVFSLWDTYRATHPLFTLTQVARTNDFINTFLRMYQQGGTLPIWELAGNETGCMIGYHSASVITDAYVKNIRDYDVRQAIKSMIATSKRDELGKAEYGSKGFIGVGDDPESVSKTLEYAYDDFTIAAMIRAYKEATGSTEFDAELEEYELRSMNFINIYDPETGFMRARRSGTWFSPFDPTEVNFNYTEANSWQYSLYTPHAIGVHTNLLGGKSELEAWLDRLFSTPSELSGRHQVDITGLIGQYAHGNEPSHHMAYLYNYTDTPEKTAFYTDSIMRVMYSNAPDGLSGNEDCGQMSSWYVLSALGFYPVAPGSPYYDFGRPILNEAMIQFESGKKLTIKTLKRSSNSKYIDKIMLNGRELKQRYISHETLVKGGKLEYHLVDKPSANYRTYATAPTIDQITEGFVPVPHRVESGRIFDDSTEVTLNTPIDAKIFYTIDGTDPKTSKSAAEFHRLVVPKDTLAPIDPTLEGSPAITVPNSIIVDKTTTVKAYAATDQGESAVVDIQLVKKDPNISLDIKSEYANQYAAYGDMTVIDGIRGNNEYRTGDWQGYWAQDIVMEVEFKSPRTLKSIGIGCLEDTKSWIFLPSMVLFEGSTDGENFLPIGANMVVNTDKEVEPANIVDLKVDASAQGPLKKIRITVVNYGKCPDWHLGAGNDTWLFIDEILFD